jgi:hypothetical protein
MLSNYTFAIIRKLCPVLYHKFFACVGVAIDAKVTAGVVHADVFAYKITFCCRIKTGLFAIKYLITKLCATLK